MYSRLDLHIVEVSLIFLTVSLEGSNLTGCLVDLVEQLGGARLVTDGSLVSALLGKLSIISSFGIQGAVVHSFGSAVTSGRRNLRCLVVGYPASVWML